MKNYTAFQSISPFKPTEITGLQWWLRADLGTTIATGVSVWADQSGNADVNRNALQATGSKQPTLNVSDPAFNNRSTLSFASASNQSLSTGAWSVPLNQPCTIFICGSDDGTVTNQTYLFNPGGVAYLICTNNGGAGVDMYSGAFLNIPGGNTASPRAIGTVFNGVSSAGYVNTHVAGVTGNAGPDGMVGPVDIGFDNIGAWLNGKIAEIIAYNSALSASDAAKVLKYLGSRYGIPIS